MNSQDGELIQEAFKALWQTLRAEKCTCWYDVMKAVERPTWFVRVAPAHTGRYDPKRNAAGIVIDVEGWRCVVLRSEGGYGDALNPLIWEFRVESRTMATITVKRSGTEIYRGNGYKFEVEHTQLGRMDPGQWEFLPQS